MFPTFTQPKKEEGKKDDTKKEEGKKEDSLHINKVKAMELKSMDDQNIKTLMKKPIEEVINKWKRQLDEQTILFNETGEKLKQFELIFNKNFENIIEVVDQIKIVEEESQKTLKNLKIISNQEDNILDQLMFMEKSLDHYLGLMDNKRGLMQDTAPREQIYSSAENISSMIDEVEKGIDEAKSKIYSSNQESTEDINRINFIDNNQNKEEYSFSGQELNEMMNSYYNSLRGIMHMEQNMKFQLSQIEYEMNNRKNTNNKEYDLI